jgi:hypothetical protein
VLKVVVEHLLEVQALRTALDKSKVVDVEVDLKVRVEEKMVDCDLRNSLFLELYDDSNSLTS